MENTANKNLINANVRLQDENKYLTKYNKELIDVLRQVKAVFQNIAGLTVISQNDVDNLLKLIEEVLPYDNENK